MLQVWSIVHNTWCKLTAGSRPSFRDEHHTVVLRRWAPRLCVTELWEYDVFSKCRRLHSPTLANLWLMLLMSSSESSVADLSASRWADVQRRWSSVSATAAAAAAASDTSEWRHHWQVPGARITVHVSLLAAAAAQRRSSPVWRLALGRGGRSTGWRSRLGRRSAGRASTARRGRVRPSTVCLSSDQNEGLEVRVRPLLLSSTLPSFQNVKRTSLL